MRLTIVVPALDEAPRIARCLQALAPLRARGARVVVCDGGSRDETVRMAAPLADRVVQGPRGRALQMNAGARTEEGRAADVLLFLRAGSELPDNADRLVFQALGRSAARWGRFDLRLQGRSPGLGPVSALLNLRSRITGIASGEQAIFVDQGGFLALEGFAPIEMMEDIEFCRRARQLSRPAVVRDPVRVPAQRWDRDGIWRTLLRAGRMRLDYFLGVAPAELARRYRSAR